MRIWNRLQTWMHRCRTCDVDGIAGSLVDRFPRLRRVESLKFGQLYRCSQCDRSWFLHEHGHWLNRIRDDHLELVQRWNREALDVDATVLDVLADIGGVQDYYGGYVAVPCSVRDSAGRLHERSLVLVSKQPPFRWPEPEKVHWADEIAAVSPSPLALPHEVRLASATKPEVSMGFAPVGVVDPQGMEYTLGAKTHFFHENDVAGAALRLSGRQKKWRNVVSPLPAETTWFVDWFDGCDERLAPTRLPEDPVRRRP